MAFLSKVRLRNKLMGDRHKGSGKITILAREPLPEPEAICQRCDNTIIDDLNASASHQARPAKQVRASSHNQKYSPLLRLPPEILIQICALVLSGHRICIHGARKPGDYRVLAKGRPACEFSAVSHTTVPTRILTDPPTMHSPLYSKRTRLEYDWESCGTLSTAPLWKVCQVLNALSEEMMYTLNTFVFNEVWHLEGFLRGRTRAQLRALRRLGLVKGDRGERELRGWEHGFVKAREEDLKSVEWVKAERL